MHAPNTSKLAYTLDRLSEETGVSARTWIRKIRSGELRSIRIGRRVLVSYEVVTDFFKAHEDNSGATARPAPAWMADPKKRAAAARKRKARMVEAQA